MLKTTATTSADTDSIANVTTVAAVVARRRTLTSSLANKNFNGVRGDFTYVWTAMFAGVGSGTISSITCAPFDLIRTRMQVWGEVSAKKQKANASSIFKDILQRNGWKGFFRGLGPSLVTVPFFWGVYFPLYDESKRQLITHYPTTSPLYIQCGSAVFAAAVSDIVCNPLFVVRTRVQTEVLHLNGEHKKSSMIQTIKSLYHESGGNLTVFWRGLSANMIGLSHVAVQFPVYERLKHLLLLRRIRHNHHHDDNGTNTHNRLSTNHPQQSSPQEHNTAGELLLASGLSKATAMVLTYPHEVIRSRMMHVRGKTGKGLITVCLRVYRHEGIRGFYSGMPISLIRVIPNSCITFMTYELLLRYARENIM